MQKKKKKIFIKHLKNIAADETMQGLSVKTKLATKLFGNSLNKCHWHFQKFKLYNPILVSDYIQHLSHSLRRKKENLKIR